MLPRRAAPARFTIDRLKDKLGNRPNASAEILLEGRWPASSARRDVASGRSSRWWCTRGSTASSARPRSCGAVAEATHHGAHRHAFGRRLVDQPLMWNVLAELCVESEAATATALRPARSFDDTAFRRLATAVAKFWVCKRTPLVVAEALECLGGKRLRGGVRAAAALAREPARLDLGGLREPRRARRPARTRPRAGGARRLPRGVRLAAGADTRFDAAVARLEQELADGTDVELRARRLVERLALALQARCSCATGTRRSRTPSARPGWRSPAACSAHSGRASSWTRSSSGTARGRSSPGSRVRRPRAPSAVTTSSCRRPSWAAPHRASAAPGG